LPTLQRIGGHAPSTKAHLNAGRSKHHHFDFEAAPPIEVTSAFSGLPVFRPVAEALVELYSNRERELLRSWLNLLGDGARPLYSRTFDPPMARTPHWTFDCGPPNEALLRFRLLPPGGRAVYSNPVNYTASVEEPNFP
jgi:hypothetical protein